jgi:hypothetical protein
LIALTADGQAHPRASQTHLDPHTPHPAGFHIGEARRIKGADVRATEGIQIACHKRECRPHECTSWRVCRVGFAERGLRNLQPSLLLQRFTRLRVDKEIEIEGLDVNLDGETVQ